MKSLVLKLYSEMYITCNCKVRFGKIFDIVYGAIIATKYWNNLDFHMGKLSSWNLQVWKTFAICIYVILFYNDSHVLMKIFSMTRVLPVPWFARFISEIFTIMIWERYVDISRAKNLKENMIILLSSLEAQCGQNFLWNFLNTCRII